MPAFKDDQLATEALRGTLKQKKKGRARLYVAAAICAVLAFAVFRQANPASSVAPASSEIPAPNKDSAPARASSEQPSPQAAVAQPATPTIVMPPVTLGGKAAEAKASLKSATAQASAPLPLGAPAPYSAVHAALRSGTPQAALELLKKTPSSAEGPPDLQEEQVLEARALLALGKIEDAKKKFEPLAFSNPDTEAGADALLGNLWCQAGSLARCRDSELELVRVGVESWGGGTAALEAARRAEESAGGEMSKLEKARALYQQALDTSKLEPEAEKQCLARLVELTNRLVLDPKAACSAPKAIFHKIEPGDVIERIAKQCKVNQGQLKRVNRLDAKLTVRFGQVLKALPGEVVYKVDRTRLTGTLYIDGVFIRRYPVGIGPGNATPQGTFVVDKKVMNPDWYYDGKRIPFGDPANILGTRWMGFSTTESGGLGAGLGVHGTAFPESVPGRESKGCVRMHNMDVEELYDFMPQGGKVCIQ